MKLWGYSQAVIRRRIIELLDGQEDELDALVLILAADRLNQVVAQARRKGTVDEQNGEANTRRISCLPLGGRNDRLLPGYTAH